MKAIERNIPPGSIQITEGAGLDPYVHGFHGAINVSFPVTQSLASLHTRAVLTQHHYVNLINRWIDAHAHT